MKLKKHTHVWFLTICFMKSKPEIVAGCKIMDCPKRLTWSQITQNLNRYEQLRAKK